MSTSSSEPTPLRRLASVALPPLAVALLGMTLAGAWATSAPAISVGYSMEEVIVKGQWERSGAIGPVDLLLLGDSSGLMDVDAEALELALGRKVEGLASLGFAGPRAYLELLRRYAVRFEARPELVLFLHPASLDADLQQPELLAYFERRALNPYPEEGYLERGRTKLYEVVRTLVDRPMVDEAGLHYGSPSDLRLALDLWHGTLEEPRPPMSPRADVAPIVYRVGPGVRDRLRDLGRGMAALGFHRVLLVASPVPEGWSSEVTDLSRERAMRGVVEALGVDVARVPLPPRYPDRYFSTPSHLNRFARQEVTHELAAALAPLLASATDPPR